MTIQYLHRMWNPETYPANAQLKAPALLDMWLRYAPDSQPADRDWEDWAENAAMLAAAHEISDGQVTLVPQAKKLWMSGDGTSLVAPQPDQPDAFMMGIFKTSDSLEFPLAANLLCNNADSVRLVQAYPKSAVFRAAAGRQFHICDGDAAQLSAALRFIREAGHAQAFVKTAWKGSAELVPIADGDDDRLWFRSVHDTSFDWFLMQHEGRNAVLYVQEPFEPTFEYRTIVVGDEVVSGAGCIEAFTPLNNWGAQFDPMMEKRRNETAPTDRTELALRYRAFAEQFAQDWAAENGSNHAYSLDLAIDARTDRVVAIEMNPLLNIGLYANDPRRIFEAVNRRFG